MGILENIATAVVQNAIPAEYMPVAVIVLAAWVGLEQWLASTNRLKANSTIQMITNVAKKVVGKNAQ